MLKGLYARQVLDQIVFQNALYLEAERLGVSVTPEEQAERIRQILPTAWAGGVWQKDLYANEVQTRTGMSVAQFENALRDEMLTDKFRAMVTAGISVSPEEVQQEFRRRNEKVKIEYALIKPSGSGVDNPAERCGADCLLSEEHRQSTRCPRSARLATRCSIWPS